MQHSPRPQPDPANASDTSTADGSTSPSVSGSTTASASDHLGALVDHTPPADLRQFWASSIPDEGKVLSIEPVQTRMTTVEISDVTFAGFDDEPIRAWFVRPAGAQEDLPVIVEFMGYGGGRSLPHQRLLYASAGYAHLAVDTRGQGGVWSVGDTPDAHGSEPSHPGFLTRGITAPETYYYRRVFTDAARAVEAARTLPGADGERVVVRGGSQGGGMSIAAAALAPGGVAAAIVNVPFLCDIPRAAVLAEDPPYTELRDFLANQRHLLPAVLRTLRYHDGVVLAGLASAPSLWSVGLLDVVCPPSTCLAAYEAWAGEKRLEVYPFNGHEGGGAHHDLVELDFLAEVLG